MQFPEDKLSPAEKSLRRPRFPSLLAARARYTAFRRERLRRLRTVAKAAGLTLDQSPESLSALEDWSFHIHATSAFGRIRRTPGELTEALHIYMGAVAVKGLRQRWIVVRDALDPRRYALDLHRWRGTSYVFDRREADDDSFWSRRLNERRSRLSDLYDLLAKWYRMEDEPAITPVLHRLSTNSQTRLDQMQLIRAGFDPFTEDGLIRASREYPSGRLRVGAIELLGDKRLARAKARKFLDDVAAHGHFAPQRLAAAIALSRLYGPRRAQSTRPSSLRPNSETSPPSSACSGTSAMPPPLSRSSFTFSNPPAASAIPATATPGGPPHSPTPSPI
jgi:hypothetical protein